MNDRHAFRSKEIDPCSDLCSLPISRGVVWNGIEEREVKILKAVFVPTKE